MVKNRVAAIPFTNAEKEFEFINAGGTRYNNRCGFVYRWG